MTHTTHDGPRAARRDHPRRGGVTGRRVCDDVGRHVRHISCTTDRRRSKDGASQKRGLSRGQLGVTVARALVPLSARRGASVASHRPLSRDPSSLAFSCLLSPSLSPSPAFSRRPSASRSRCSTTMGCRSPRGTSRRSVTDEGSAWRHVTPRGITGRRESTSSYDATQDVPFNDLKKRSVTEEGGMAPHDVIRAMPPSTTARRSVVKVL